MVRRLQVDLYLYILRGIPNPVVIEYRYTIMARFGE